MCRVKSWYTRLAHWVQCHPRLPHRVWWFLRCWSPYSSEFGVWLSPIGYAELVWDRLTEKRVKWGVIAPTDPRRRLEVPLYMPWPRGGSWD